MVTNMNQICMKKCVYSEGAGGNISTIQNRQNAMIIDISDGRLLDDMRAGSRMAMRSFFLYSQLPYKVVEEKKQNVFIFLPCCLPPLCWAAVRARSGDARDSEDLDIAS